MKANNYSYWDLMAIEADEKILSFKNKEGTPWWFYFRYEFLNEWLTQKLELKQNLLMHREKNLDAVKFIIKSIVHNIFHCKLNSSDIAFYVTSRPLMKDGKYYNRYADPFYELCPEKTIVYENAPLNWQWYKPRLYNNFNFYTFNLVKYRLVSKFPFKQSPELIQLLNFLSDRTKNLFGFNLMESEKKYFAKFAISNYNTYLNHFRWFIKKLKNHQTKLLMVPGASYSHYCDLNRLAHKAGIITADIQHGAICSSNIMYSFDEHIVNSVEVKNIIPDYYLTYGSWWSKQTNIPYKKIEIGNPLRKYLLAHVNYDKPKDKILIIGSANNTRGNLEITQKLTEKYKQYQVLFRPHPTEKRDTEALLEQFPNVSIDYGNDLYQELAESYAVISEMSTVIYESIGLSERILIWRTQYSKNMAPDNCFEEFHSIDELFNLLDKKNYDVNYVEKDFWNENIELNYSNFLKTLNI